MFFRSTTARIVGLHFVLAALASVLVFAFVYWSTARVVDGELRQVVQTEIAGLSDSYRNLGVLGLVEAIGRRLHDADQKDGVYLLTDSQGRPIAGNLAGWPPNAPTGGWVQLDLFRTDRDRAGPVEAATFRLPGGEQLLVGRDATARVKLNETLFRALATALAVTALLAAATGWLISRFILRRLAEVTVTADEIVAGGLTRRVPLRGTDDEFDRLGGTLNAMLDRIEALVGEMRLVTDSVAHDLRSPLTRLAANLDRAAGPGIRATERKDLIEKASAEAAGILSAFTALLAIARLEAGMGRDQFTSVDLGRLLDDAKDVFEPVAEEKNIRLERVGASSPVLGHGQLLAQAASNLIENALKHAPSGSEIRLDSGTITRPVLAVADHGPGISASDRALAVQRFVRLDPSRSGPGTGLGLSLVAAIARMHGAELGLSDNRPGLRAEITFAALAPPEGGTATPAPAR
jgi:signal transduction histidine kinase